MLCQACLRENDPFAKFCCDCGRSLTGQLVESPGAVGVWSDRARRCEGCGATIPPRSRFCTECGAAPAMPVRRSRRTGIVVGAVVGIVLIIATAAALLVPGHFG